MGEPVRLVRGTETMTVYGGSQLVIELERGWCIAGDDNNDIIKVDKPVEDVSRPQRRKRATK